MTSDNDPDAGLRRISLAELGERIARRRAEYEAKYGPIEIPRNAGQNRTASKRALFRAIKDVGGDW